MPFRRPRFTLKWLMIAVAVVALILAPIIWVDRYISNALNAFYGPGGTLQRPRSGVPNFPTGPAVSTRPGTAGPVYP